jgi:hypothetical protein
MIMDKQNLNTVYNQLKELVGKNGTFVLFCASPVDAEREDVQVRTYGPTTHQIGLLDTCGALYRETLGQGFKASMRPAKREPD